MTKLDPLLLDYPATKRLVDAVLEVMPKQADYLRKGFESRSPDAWAATEHAAVHAETLCEGKLARLVEGYQWMCAMILEEELHFRRNDAYRHTTLAEVDDAVYQNADDMSRYMDGLLASQVLWLQHARALDFYLQAHLPSLVDGYRHLEIGPGHGLLLYYAAVDPRCAQLVACDISPTSLEHTAGCLAKLAADRRPELIVGGAADLHADPGSFDSVVISEVLEHVEDPAALLKSVRPLVSGEGRVYVNVPVNSPTVDHITLLRSPEEVFELVEGAGFVIEDRLIAPIGGYAEERARRQQLSISVALTARVDDRGR